MRSGPIIQRPACQGPRTENRSSTRPLHEPRTRFKGYDNWIKFEDNVEDTWAAVRDLSAALHHLIRPFFLFGADHRQPASAEVNAPRLLARKWVLPESYHAIRVRYFNRKAIVKGRRRPLTILRAYRPNAIPLQRQLVYINGHGPND